ncbi:endo alpha-1,4 polygalactosaminidase [Pseudonocardia ailaonensis]|uniref:Endo alpha-1,4 polygalactosaminidase n=1 Tax=Pseudonocardia ailaonensis TaxID=367279 RepID=A0ABN2NG69_9PSEU
MTERLGDVFWRMFRRVRTAPFAAVSLALAACTTAVPVAATQQAVAPQGSGWQYQLQGRIDTTVPARTFVVDLFDTPESTVRELKAAGRTVICYVNAGASETWRRDSAALPEVVRGDELAEWPGEHWYDIRRTDLLGPFLSQRFDLCRQKGFDGVEADNVDGYANRNGLGLTAADQLTYNRFVARLAHDRGLTIGLKNDLEQVAALEPSFDFAVNEQCAQYGECARLEPFVKAGKPVLHVEYTLSTAEFCADSSRQAFQSIRKPKDLTAPREACPG